MKQTEQTAREMVLKLTD